MSLVVGMLRQIDPPGPTVRFQWNPSQVVRQSGVGGWDEIERPRRKAALEHRGTPAHTVEFELLFDGFPARSVEPALSRLHLMAIPVGGPNSGSVPPRLQLVYGPWQQLRWVIDDLIYGASIRRADLSRVRQWVTVRLREHTAVDVLPPPAERAVQRQAADPEPTPSGRVYTVRAGDTLSAIASRELGDHRRWPEIAELNELRDPNRISVGQELRLP